MDFDFEGWLGAWDRHDGAEMASYFTDDAVYEDTTLMRRLEGRDEIATFVGETEEQFSTDFRLELRDVKASERGYVLEWRWTGTHDRSSPLPPVQATGKPFELYGVSTGEFGGDKIKANRDYWNAAAFLLQVGHPLPDFAAAGMAIG